MDLPAGDADRGAYVAHMGGCASCHTVGGGAAYAGGHRVETRFGTFVAPNVTPDREHGIGAWTAADFVRAMREGRAPDGRRYWPAFPYPSYTRTTDADLADLWVFLQGLEPAPTPDPASEPRGIARVPGGLAIWRAIELDPGAWTDDPDRDAVWNRGAYLVNGPAHCGECHTPRNLLGGPRERRFLSGSDSPPEPAPNITPHADGIAGWSISDVAELLSSGMEPDGDVVGNGMRDVVRDGTSHLTDADRTAIATYLTTVEPHSGR